MMTSIHIGFKIKCLIQNGTGVNVHMKITFFIGNGFDLKMGLKSRYKDFYNYLLSQNYENIIVDKIKDNQDEWADFELACGKELRNITIDNMEEFIGAFGNFKIEFSKYLSEQEKDINYDQLSDEIADKTCNSINNFYKRTDLARSQKLSSIINSCKQKVIFNFIIFNYTNLFQNVIDITTSKYSSVGSHEYGGTKYLHSIGECIKIHGSLSQDMIMGVNDNTQIYNEDLKNNRKIKTVFIKPFLNDRLGNLKNEKVSQLINDSEIICIYGMSLGNSDNFWWGKILQWLKNSSNRYLVIFKYLGDEYSNTILSYQSLIKEDEDIDDFLTRYKMDNQEKDRVSRQIIFSYNSDLFDFQLINQKADKILV